MESIEQKSVLEDIQLEAYELWSSHVDSMEQKSVLGTAFCTPYHSCMLMVSFHHYPSLEKQHKATVMLLMPKPIAENTMLSQL